MSDVTRRINAFFRTAIKKDVDSVYEKILLSERQKKIFQMFYIDKQNIGFIADTLGICNMVVNNELKIIRSKMSKILGIK